ncbi:hypothetical protein B0O99DRAFT_223105 [Bisporella sp. PMI_857]|nr:hypothetical protein B0O99DRAFT_223105 [Bisporella sp. PMI_857]
MGLQADRSQADYIMASEEEMSRLSSQHNIIKHAMGGLLLVPVNLSAGGLRILDSATADGTWVLDLHSSAPGNTFVGTDIDASKFPVEPPPSVTFQGQDINVPWPTELRESFDIVSCLFGEA